MMDGKVIQRSASASLNDTATSVVDATQLVETICQALTRLRTDTDLSKRKTAKILGIGRNRLAKIEAGQVEHFSLHTIADLVTAYEGTLTIRAHDWDGNCIIECLVEKPDDVFSFKTSLRGQLRQWRERIQISQVKISQVMMCSHDYVYKMEKGASGISPFHLYLYAKGCGGTVTVLINDRHGHCITAGTSIKPSTAPKQPKQRVILNEYVASAGQFSRNTLIVLRDLRIATGQSQTQAAQVLRLGRSGLVGGETLSARNGSRLSLAEFNRRVEACGGTAAIAVHDKETGLVVALSTASPTEAQRAAIGVDAANVRECVDGKQFMAAGRNILQSMRNMRGLSRKEAEKILGIKSRRIWRIETGYHSASFTFNNLYEFATKYGAIITAAVFYKSEKPVAKFTTAKRPKEKSPAVKSAAAVPA
jgi:transcriptional regulator with XRE-family HTH domain